MSSVNDIQTKRLQGTSVQQMWEILRAHEIRLNNISEFLDTENSQIDVEQHVLGLKGVKNTNVRKTRGKNVTINVGEEN